MWYRIHQWNSSASWILLVGAGLNPRYWGTFRRRHERRCPQPFSGSTGAHCRLPRMAGARWPETHGAVHGARDPRLIKLPPGGACVDVTPNLVWIAQVGDRVQVRHDLGHVLAHEAEDVVTKVRTRPREHGLLMAGSGCGRHVHVIVAEIGYRVRGDEVAKVVKLAPVFDGSGRRITR